MEDDREQPDGVRWTDDGQVLAVSATNGRLVAYLTKLPMLGAVFADTAAFLTNLAEVTVVRDPAVMYKVDVTVEPQTLAVGPKHVHLYSPCFLLIIAVCVQYQQSHLAVRVYRH